MYIVYCSQSGIHLFEDIVGGFVLTAPFVPAFDNSLVVSEYLEMNVGGAIMEESKDEEFKTDTFNPPNVIPASIPALLEKPSMPASIWGYPG